MILDIKEESDNKRLDWEIAALAANQSTNKVLLDRLHSLDQNEISDEDMEWFTPESPEEIEGLLELLNQVKN